MRAANGKAFQRKKNPWKEEQCAKKLRDFFRVDLPLDLRRWRKQIEQIQLAPPGGRSGLLNDSTYQHSRACSWGQRIAKFLRGWGWGGRGRQCSSQARGGVGRSLILTLPQPWLRKGELLVKVPKAS